MKFKINPEFEKAQKEGWKIPLGVSESEQIASLKEQTSKSGIHLTDDGARELIRQALSGGQD